MEEIIKKPVWKRWWFWAIAVVLVIGIALSGSKTKLDQSKSGMTFEEITSMIWRTK